MFFGNYIPATAVLVLLAGLAILAILDLRRREVDGSATAILGAALAVILVREPLQASQWIFGFASAVVAFGFYLERGRRGRMGGGDVKLIAIPAFVLGLIHPLLAVWGIFVLVFGVQMAVRLVHTLVTRAESTTVPEPLPHVPAIFAGTAIALFSTGALALL